MPRGGHAKFPKPIRLPADAYSQPDRVFHVIIRALPETTPFRDPALGDDIWSTVCTQTNRGEVLVFAACLMPDHLHLLVSVVRGNLVDWVGSFKRFTTRQRWAHGIHGALWQPSFYDRGLREGEFDSVLAYIQQNPVEAALVEDPFEWPWLGVSVE